MKRIVFIVLLSFLATSLPKQNGVCHQAASLNYSLSNPTIPQYLVDLVLKAASQKLPISYQDLCQDYLDGKCNIDQVSIKEYKISAGGGMTIIILDDAL